MKVGPDEGWVGSGRYISFESNHAMMTMIMMMIMMIGSRFHPKVLQYHDLPQFYPFDSLLHLLPSNGKQLTCYNALCDNEA
jgi:hypothetical protein